jgi:uncharacterized protein YdcH (DUF465 family)
MSELGHDLHHEFSADHDALHELKVDNPYFRELAAKHHDLVQQIYRVESGLEAASDARLEDLKKLRLSILDKIATLIAARKAT